MKNCPYCAEEIKEEAIVCKHCKSSLNEEDKIEAGLREEYTKNFNSKKPKKNSYSDWNDENAKGTGKITENYILFLVVLIIAAGYWISLGTPNPSLFFSAESAKDNCLRLANKNKNKGIFVIKDAAIRVNDTWLKDGMRVVQLLQNEDDNINEIMCIVGNDMVEIPNILNQGKWR